MAEARSQAPCGDAGKNAEAALERAFTRIHAERMRDIPILNPRLRVEAVGFRREDDGWVGVLITPWFINVVVLPHRADPAAAVAAGAGRSRVFPAGIVDFIGACEGDIGPFLACSLLSPVTEIADQETARELARAALDELYRGDAVNHGAGNERSVSKRDFLFHAFRSAAR